MSRLLLLMSIYNMLCFFSDPTIFEKAVKDAQWNQANEVVVIDEQHQDVNALQEKMKYIHIFSDKTFQFVGKDDI